MPILLNNKLLQVNNKKTPNSHQKQLVGMPRKLTVEFDSEDSEDWGDDDSLLLEGAQMSCSPAKACSPVQSCSPVPPSNSAQTSDHAQSLNLGQHSNCVQPSILLQSCSSVQPSQSALPSNLPVLCNKPLIALHDMSDNSVLDLLKDVDFSDFSDDDELEEDLASFVMQEDIDTPRRKNKTLSLRKS